MKEYFKYRHGYLNVDDENFYLTESGNWAEARELKEKSTSTKREKMVRIVAGFIFQVLLVILIAFVIGSAIDSTESLSLTLLVGIGVALLNFSKRYTYIQSMYGTRIKIPMAKIQYLSIFNSELEIHFKDSQGKATKERLEGFKFHQVESIRELLQNKIEILNEAKPIDN